MAFDALGLTAIVSAITSILTTIILKVADLIIKAKLEQRKTMLSYKSQVSYEYAKRKMENYPNIAALVYRIRNHARGFISESGIKLNQEAVVGFAALLKKYEDELYKERTLLESDGIFFVLHQYKGEATMFLRTLSGLKKQLKTNNKEGISYHENLLRRSYQEIDQKHVSIVNVIIEKEDGLRKL